MNFEGTDARRKIPSPENSAGRHHNHRRARDLALAARMLQLLGVRAVRLLTNNPAKVAALANEGVAVIERVPHAPGANPHNHHYLATKRDRAGHLL